MVPAASIPGHFIDDGASIAAHTGTITLTGTGGGGASHGNEIDGNVTSTGAGAITITSIGAGGSASLYNDGTSATIGGGSYSGNITLNQDSAIWGSLAIDTTANALITPHTGNTTIGVANSGEELNITSGILGTITAGNITIGSTTDSGNMTVSAGNWMVPLKLLNGSGNIEFSGNQTLGANTLLADTTSGNIKLDSGATITSTATSGYPIILAASGGNFINDSGSDSPLTVGAGAHWAVYSTSVAGDTNGASAHEPGYYPVQHLLPRHHQ